MASTFSSLKIELIGTGEQDGIWGDTTNTNLGTAVEQAITGSGDVTFTSADVTLTLANTNSAQVARNLRLVCVGTSGGARQLIVPSIEKQYIVRNNLADTVTIKTSAGTGIAVPAGKTTIVFNDGTNVVEVINSLATPLPVVSGGTGLATLTANNVILGNGTSTPNFVSPATSGNFLRSNGTTWESAAPPGAEFSAGTRMTFNQTAAPTGWTKDTSVDNAAFRLVSGSVGSGGTVDFTTAFASQTPAGSVSTTISSVSGSAGATTLTTPQIPSHTHTVQIFNNPEASGGATAAGQSPLSTFDTGATGGGGSHTHPFSFSSGSASSTFSGTALNLAVKYADLIIAQKN